VTDTVSKQIVSQVCCGGYVSENRIQVVFFPIHREWCDTQVGISNRSWTKFIRHDHSSTIRSREVAATDTIFVTESHPLRLSLLIIAAARFASSSFLVRVQTPLDHFKLDTLIVHIASTDENVADIDPSSVALASGFRTQDYSIVVMQMDIWVTIASTSP